MADTSTTEHGPSGAGGVRSIERAAQVLAAIGLRGAEGSRLGDVVTETGLSKSTAHRIVHALQSASLVDVDPDTGALFPSSAWVSLGANAANRHGLVDLAGPSLDRLADLTQDTVHLFVRSGDEVVCVDRVVGDYPVKTLTIAIGDRRPLGIGAGSLAVLAALPEDEREPLLERAALHAGDRYTMPIDRAALRHIVARSAASGVAINESLVIAGTTGVAVAVRLADGRPWASLSVAAIATRLEGERRDTVIDALRRETATLERQLADVIGEGGRAARHMLLPGGVS